MTQKALSAAMTFFGITLKLEAGPLLKVKVIVWLGQ